LEIGIDHRQPLGFFRLQYDLLVAETERRRYKGDLLPEPSRGELPVEGDVVATDKQGKHYIRPHALDSLNDRAEIDYVKRDEFLRDQLALRLLEIQLHPIGGNMAVVVVSSERIEL